MIPWIQIFMQGTTNPFIRILATDLSILDQQGVSSDYYALPTVLCTNRSTP